MEIGGYVLERRLGAGGMGQVWIARHTVHRALHAVKLVHLHSELARARFLREGQGLAELSHPNVVRVHQCLLLGETGLLSMDLLEGHDLGVLVAQDAAGRLPWPRVVEIARPLASALAHVHARGLVHRDVKPSNAVLAEGRVLLCDFGLVHLEGADRLTRSGQLLGTPHFMAPEQAFGRGEPSAAADVYGLGATLFFLLSGSHVHEATTLAELVARLGSGSQRDLRELVPDLPVWLASLVGSCLTHDPLARPSASQVLQRLETGAAPTSRYAVWLGALATVALGAAVVGVLSRSPRSPRPAEPPARPPPAVVSQVPRLPELEVEPETSAPAGPPERTASNPLLDLLEEQARKGDVLSAGQLGVALVNDHQDFPAGHYWTFLAARSGDAIAIRALGSWHASGAGGLPQDWDEARRWYERGASVSGPCALRLAEAYRHGDPLTREVDPARSRRYLELAVSLNDTHAQLQLAKLEHAAGNLRRAFELARMAGTPPYVRGEALLMLARFYARGEGTEQDLAAARRSLDEFLARDDADPNLVKEAQRLQRELDHAARGR